MFVLFLLLWLLICFIIFQFKSQRPKKFPPGPTPLPILGNLHNLSLENPLDDFERLRRKYGNVYSLYLGFKPVVVLCGVQAIKEALVNKATDFAGRPQDLYVNVATENKESSLPPYVLLEYGHEQDGGFQSETPLEQLLDRHYSSHPHSSLSLTSIAVSEEARAEGPASSGTVTVTWAAAVDARESEGVILADYGPRWKDHRRFALMTLRNFGLGKQSMEERILGEIQHTIAILEKSIGSSLCPQVMFHNASSNIICQVLFGKRFEYENESMKEIVRCFTENAKLANGPWAMLYDSIPMIRGLPLPFNKAFKNVATCQCIARRLIAEHKNTRVPGQPRDFVDCYLDEVEKRGNDGSTFSEDQLGMYSLDLHFAGTDTTSNTLLTGFLYLMNHPHVQERCQEEIDKVLEGKDYAAFDDRHNMPYVQAVIHEVQRIANTVPLSVFHSTTKDTEVMGYVIPKGTLIIPNLSTVLREEGQWKFPHEFNPENFLDDKGEFVKPEAFMPFSAGPRMCLGEGLARMELFLITVTLLRKFKFIWPEDAGEPDYTPVYGVTLTPQPYRMKIQLRDSH